MDYFQLKVSEVSNVVFRTLLDRRGWAKMNNGHWVAMSFGELISWSCEFEIFCGSPYEDSS